MWDGMIFKFILYCTAVFVVFICSNEIYFVPLHVDCVNYAKNTINNNKNNKNQKTYVVKRFIYWP